MNSQGKEQMEKLKKERDFLYLYPQAPMWKIRKIEDKIKK